MNIKNKIFSFIEVLVECLKYHGVVTTVKVFYYYSRCRFLKKSISNTYNVLGFKIKVENKDYLPDIIFEHFGFNTYFFNTTKKRPVIVDIGANIGDTAIYFKWLYPNCSIYAFEPHPEAFKLLVKNVQLNKLKSIFAFNTALGNSVGKINLYSSDNTYSRTSSINSSAKINDSKVEKIQSSITKIDSFEVLRNIKNIDLLKIDIEGAESELFETLDNILIKTNKVVLEYHITKNVKNNSFDFIINMLKKHSLEPGIRGPYNTDSNYSNSNLFFIIAERKTSS